MATPWNTHGKRKAPRAPKARDRRAEGRRACEREQRIARVQLLEMQAEREAFLGHKRNAERLSHHAAEMRDAAP